MTEARRLVDEHQEATRDGGSGRYATCVKERVPRARNFPLGQQPDKLRLKIF